MDRYQRVERPRPESAINDNEIRITSQGLIRNYIIYATSLLQEECLKEIVLRGMGKAVSKTVSIAEILKKKIPGLHQDLTISSTSVTDVWEPMEEGLETVETTRHVSMISITLSFEELDKNSPGYQAPLTRGQPRKVQVKQISLIVDKKKSVELIEISSSDHDDSDSESIRPRAIAVNTENKDCCIIDYNPYMKLNLNGKEDDDDVCVVSEIGEVACRDFPHPRHICGVFVFNKTPDESYCPQCYCYVCDKPVPCKNWARGPDSHCHASDNDAKWKKMKMVIRKLTSSNACTL